MCFYFHFAATFLERRGNETDMEYSPDNNEKNGWSLKRPATPSQAIPIPSSKTRHGKLEPFSLPTQFGTPERTVDVEPYSFAGEAASHSSSSSSNLLPLYSFFFTPPEDEHVTVWEPLTGKTVAGNAAPYRKNLRAWLESHPGWEEKADELKSSKRRSLLRRRKQVQTAFSNLLANGELAYVLKSSAEKVLTLLGSMRQAGSDSDATTLEQESSHSLSKPTKVNEWSSEEITRLQEALVYLGEEFLAMRDRSCLESTDKWRSILNYVFYKTIHIEKNSWGNLEQEHLKELLEYAMKLLESSSHRISSEENHLNFSSSSLSSSPKADDMHPSNDQIFQMPPLFLSPSSFTSHREPRITVWDPKTGRTISGNAAPCAKNLESWMALHPGWVPKSEEYLSSSRKGRQRRGKGRISVHSSEVASSAPSVLSMKAAASNEDNSHPNSLSHFSASVQLAESPAFNDALDGLLLMQICNPTNTNETLNRHQSADNPSSSSVSSSSQDNKHWDKTQDAGMEYIDMELEEHNS